MAECKLCKTEFDEKTAERLDCNCGCGGDLVLCPNCGYAIKLSSKQKKENKGFFQKIADSLRMGY